MVEYQFWRVACGRMLSSRIVKAIDLREESRLSSGSEKIDRLLNGGFPREGLIEITGESGCGKSQLCKQLTLTVQYPPSQGGFDGVAVYICTEERFQSGRLHQLIENFPGKYYRHSNNDIKFGDNVLVVHAREFADLEKCLRKVPFILRRKNVKLVIIDSITAVFRNYNTSESRKRARELRAVGNLLHKLSAVYKLLIICVNQVSQSLKTGQIVPALGLAWANIITSRIFLSRCGSSRFITVVFSPELPSRVMTEFSIEEYGIH